MFSQDAQGLRKSMIFRLGMAGRNLIDTLMRTLPETRFSFTPTVERQMAYDNEGEALLCCTDYEQELEIVQGCFVVEENHEFPDRQAMTIGVERSRCPEVFPPTISDRKENSRNS